MSEPGAPVLVGVSQLTLRDPDAPGPADPVSLMERAARGCAEDAGLDQAALASLDCVGLVDTLGWRPANGPRLLAERLGARPAHEWQAALGGESPLVLLNTAAAEIAEGRAKLALLAGSNNYRDLRRAMSEKKRTDWPQGGEGAPQQIGVVKPGSSDRENAVGLNLPPTFYPVFENALRHRRGLTLDEHRARMGALFAPFTEVAAGNPHAWFPVKRSAEELVTVGERNRMIAFPYTKYLNAVLETVQAAAVLVTSVENARALGIPEDRWIHWWGGANANESIWWATERPDLARCPALAASVETALRRAGTTLGDLDCFDFYSCFPSAVSMACEMLGLPEDDPRDFTVTGGLPYAGGPGNNYCLHAAAAMVERLRERGGRGMVTGNGWYLTKHSAAVLSREPREGGVASSEVAAPAAPDEAPVTLVDEPAGSARVEAYTVVFDRDGAPMRGIVVGALEGGGRFLANTPDDRTLLEDFVAVEAVGRAGRVAHADGRNTFEPR